MKSQEKTRVSVKMNKMIEGKHLKPFSLFPAKPGTCPECAVEHDEKQPHNKQSLFYQFNFYNTHGVWPTWGDAMAHCDDAIKQYWKSELSKRGVNENEFEPSKQVLRVHK